MSTPTTIRGSSTSQRLCATSGNLQDGAFGVNIATSPSEAEFEVFEQEAFGIRRNSLVPINRIPPEILTLIPDFWNVHERDELVIALTHVCRAWREVFTSRSSLWTDLDCTNVDKTEVYLKRSKSSPINLSLRRVKNLSPHDPFIRIIPRAIGRLRSLSVEGKPGNLQDIIAHLSHPAPLLEDMLVDGGCHYEPHRNPVLAPSLFNGDLSSLQKLCLECVRTELPWRNMVNLTSFILAHVSPVSIRRLLDFFEDAPHIREVDLYSGTVISDAQNGRLVSLACLERMLIDYSLSSPLLDYLLIPVGADLSIEVDPPPVEGRPPRFFDNLRNLPGFTTIRLHSGALTYMEFSGPNGRVIMNLMTAQVDETRLVLKSLAHFDTSKTERLEFHRSYLPPGDPPSWALLPMENLRTLTLSRFRGTGPFIHALDPRMSSLQTVVCPKLEGIVLVLGYAEKLDIMDVIGMAAARASRGARLKSIKIVNRDRSVYAQHDILELGKHVCMWDIDGVNGVSDGSNEEG